MPASIPDSEDDESTDLASSIAATRMKSIDGSFQSGDDIGFGGTQAARENVLMPVMDSSMLWTVGQDLQTRSTCKTRRTQSSGQTVHELSSETSRKTKKKQKRHHTVETDYLSGDNITVQQPTITQELAARAEVARAEDSSSLIKTPASEHNVRHVIGVVIPVPPPAGSPEMVIAPSPSDIADSITVSDPAISTHPASSKSSKEDNAKAMPPPDFVMPTQPATPSASGSNSVATPAPPEFAMPSQPASSMASTRAASRASNRRAQTTIFEDHPGLAERPEPSPNLRQQQEGRKKRGRQKKNKAPEEIPETQAEAAAEAAPIEEPLAPQASSESCPPPPARSSQQTQSSSRKKRAATPVIAQADEIAEATPVGEATPPSPVATTPTLAAPREAKRQESPLTEDQYTDRSTHSPIKRSGNALLRVGLSKRQRIQPLLKVMKR